jgi:hypothetical protein
LMLELSVRNTTVASNNILWYILKIRWHGTVNTGAGGPSWNTGSATYHRHCAQAGWVVDSVRWESSYLRITWNNKCQMLSME